MTSLQRACRVYFNVRFEGPINQFGQGPPPWRIGVQLVQGKCPTAAARNPAHPHTGQEGRQHRDREGRTVRFCALLTLRLE